MLDKDTVPSRLDELTENSRLEEKAQYSAGWRRNGLVIAAVVVAALLIGWFR
ncbi:MAG: hypothetical protein KKC85_06575 [Gammaproteobacteria bacterium]|nr:hypothetical protein [Gammaproteobacteria bacterium]MBU1441775.1 hypothetical protein [Gammaproteobacteria bacterium]MBU2286084.1 hypothetical protein [Gammaproteobacteria bacterium]